ncbi:MAG: glycosyltransferase family 9 protein [Planctomycetales bacterium]|nr:glycosyltransferase family 9 protein [Planctomycetales bacterium]
MLPTWVGDACMATPCLRAIRQQFADAHITGIMRPVLWDVIAGSGGCEWFDDSLFFQKRACQKHPSRWRIASILRERRIDTVVLLTNSFWSAAVARLSGARRVIGYARDKRSFLLTDAIPVAKIGRSWKPIPAIDYYLGLARWMGCETLDRRMCLPVSQEDWELHDELYKSIGFASSFPTIVINNNTASHSSRLWPLANVVELALQLVQGNDCQVLIHCGPNERQHALRAEAEANHPLVASMGRCTDLPIGLSKAVMASAQVVVTTDSGPRHMAIALNSNVVTLFGSTTPEWTTTYNRPEICIQANQGSAVDNFSSSTPVSKMTALGIQDISVSEVLDSVQWFLRSTANLSAA